MSIGSGRSTRVATLAFVESSVRWLRSCSDWVVRKTADLGTAEMTFPLVDGWLRGRRLWPLVPGLPSTFGFAAAASTECRRLVRMSRWNLY